MEFGPRARCWHGGSSDTLDAAFVSRPEEASAKYGKARDQ